MRNGFVFDFQTIYYLGKENHHKICIFQFKEMKRILQSHNFGIYAHIKICIHNSTREKKKKKNRLKIIINRNEKKMMTISLYIYSKKHNIFFSIFPFRNTIMQLHLIKYFEALFNLFRVYIYAKGKKNCFRKWLKRREIFKLLQFKSQIEIIFIILVMKFNAQTAPSIQPLKCDKLFNFKTNLCSYRR